MTISGAAVSPNMGYNSSPAYSILMTLFNVRLGAWYGNPGPGGKPSRIMSAIRLIAKRLETIAAIGDARKLPSRLTSGLRSIAKPLEMAPAVGKAHKQSSPIMSVFPLIAEALGITTAGRRYVYLSDGGHFEKSGRLRNGSPALPRHHHERRG